MMTDLAFTKEEQQELTSRRIRAVVLFGSQAQNTARPDSDYDVFIISKYSRENYDFLYDLLSEKIKKLVNIDIVFQDKAPLELQNHVAKFGQPIFEENTSTFANFKQNVMLLYADFAPLRQMFQKATLDRISP